MEVNMIKETLCPMCGVPTVEGWYQRFKRKDGVHTCVTFGEYCDKCTKTPEFKELRERVFAIERTKDEAIADANFEKFGMYTNVTDFVGPSAYFACVKEGAWRPSYLSRNPNCQKNALNRALGSVVYTRKPDRHEEARRMVAEFDVEDWFKDLAYEKIDWSENFAKEQGWIDDR